MLDVGCLMFDIRILDFGFRRPHHFPAHAVGVKPRAGKILPSFCAVQMMASLLEDVPPSRSGM